MADQLDFQKALSFARQLKAIPGFPWDEDVITSHAHHLMRWCKGAIFEDGRVWSAEAQAHWLITEAQERWEKWIGAAELLKLFRTRFVKELEPGNAYHPLGEKPPVECKSCNDFGIVKMSRGYQYCDCSQGQSMAADPDLGEDWLRVHNGGQMVPYTRQEMNDSQRQEAEFFAHIERVGDTIAEARATLEDPDATNEQKQLAQEALRLYEAKAKKPKKQPHGPGDLR